MKEEPNVLDQPEVSSKPEVQNKQDKSEVTSNEEDNKQSKVLPQTGGASTEATLLSRGC